MTSAAPAADKPAASPIHGEYVGSVACKDCHAEIYKNFEATPHWKIALDKLHVTAPSESSCEGCHGPASEHVKAGGDPGKIFSFKKASSQQIVDTCLVCHQYGQEHSNFLRSAHKTSDVTCIDCHSPHHAKEPQFLLAKAQPQLCYGCHLDVRPDFSKPFHHRVNEGLVRCTDCHNQHGGVLPRMLRTSTAQDSACLKCHSEKAGPFVFEHPGVRTEGCSACHLPHGSANPQMLKRSQVNQLCLECHTFTPGMIAPGTVSFHDVSAQYQACTLCHINIHGSNFSRFFLR